MLHRAVGVYGRSGARYLAYRYLPWLWTDFTEVMMGAAFSMEAVAIPAFLHHDCSDNRNTGYGITRLDHEDRVVILYCFRRFGH